MTVTASTMILSALRMIGEKAPGGTLTTAEQTDYLYDLNAAMDSWSIDRSMVYQLLQENFPLVAGTVSYTIGTGGTFDTTRPTKIETAFVRDTANYDRRLRVIGQHQYDAIRMKSIGNTYPNYIFYDTAYVSGLGTIRVYPAPVAGLTLYIDSWKQLQQFSSISTALALPPGYQLAIESNFAVMKAGGFTRASPELLKTAKDSMAAIKSLNTPDMVMRLDPMTILNGGSNIITGP